MRSINYTISKEYNNRPLLHFLKGELKLSTHIVQSLRHTNGAVLINGNFARVVDIVSEGDTLEINFPEKTQPPLLWDKDLEIIFEDQDLLVINKPSGISVHPTFNHPNETLCNAVANYLLKTQNAHAAARAIGRLDKVTSGVLIFAKNAYTASRLNGNIEKIYNAIAYGCTPEKGTINAPIYRPDFSKTTRAVGEQGDKAITHFKTIMSSKEKSFLEITTETGRTHQIRVHMAHIGHPLMGDEMYGAPLTENLKRAALHCNTVTIIHPVTKEEITFTAPLPEDMKNELNTFCVLSEDNQ